MVKKKVDKKQEEKEKITFGFLGAFFTIVGFIIAIAVKKDDKYVMHYGKHGLVLFIGYVIAWFLYMIPFIGWFVLGPLSLIFVTILWLITWINALSGKQKDTWVVGEFAKKIKV